MTSKKPFCILLQWRMHAGRMLQVLTTPSVNFSGGRSQTGWVGWGFRNERCATDPVDIRQPAVWLEKRFVTQILPILMPQWFIGHYVLPVGLGSKLAP